MEPKRRNGDEWGNPPRESMTVVEQEREPQRPILYRADGTPLIQRPTDRRIGFKVTNRG